MAFVSEKRYRLRIGNEIVGYLRKIDNRSHFYSKDSFWWNGRPIDYREIDEWTGLVDKNRTPIYEWDILYFKVDPDEKDCIGVVLWQSNLKRFVMRKVDDEQYFPFHLDGLELFNSNQLKVFSHLFLNPDLQDYLGLKDE